MFKPEDKQFLESEDGQWAVERWLEDRGMCALNTLRGHNADFETALVFAEEVCK